MTQSAAAVGGGVPLSGMRRRYLARRGTVDAAATPSRRCTSERRDGTTERYDVIVVGSGGGLIGAYAAASRGLRTLVIEKTEYVGGTTAYSGAGIWLPGNPAMGRAGIEDSPDAARPYLDAIVGDDAPASLREAFLQAGPPMIEELEQNPRFQQFAWRGVPDYFEGAAGQPQEGPHDLPAGHRHDPSSATSSRSCAGRCGPSAGASTPARS